MSLPATAQLLWLWRCHPTAIDRLRRQRRIHASRAQVLEGSRSHRTRSNCGLAPALETLDALIADGARAASISCSSMPISKTTTGTMSDHLVLLRSGGVLAIDNVLWKGQVADPK